MRARLGSLIHRGDHDVLVHGLGLAPLLALSGDVALTAWLSLVFALTLFCVTLILMPLRYLVGAPLRIVVAVLTAAMVVTACDRVLALAMPGLHVALGIYLGVIAMNLLVMDRIEHVLTDRWLDADVTPGHEWRYVLGRVGVTVLSVWFVVACVVLVRAIAAHAGFLPAALLGFSGPTGLAFFQTPGGALVSLGLVLAVIRQAAALEEGDD